MKAQCEHSDTGLCKTCFKYEQKIVIYEKALEDVIKYQKAIFSGMGMCSTVSCIAEAALKEGK